MAVIAYWHFVLDFKVRNIWVDVSRIAFVLMNVASDVMAVLVMYAMMDEELLNVTDEYLTLLYAYIVFTVLSVWCSLVRILWLRAVIYWNIENLKQGGLAANSNERNYEARKISFKKDVTTEAITACRQELAVTCLGCILCDFPIFIVQMMMLTYVLNQELVVSLPLIWSMIFSAITIGSVSNSTVEFSLYRMISLLHGGYSEVSIKQALILIINPFATCSTSADAKDTKQNIQAN